MPFSCLPASLYPEISSGERTLAGWFRLAADIGLDGADISVAHLDSLEGPYLDGLRRQAQDAGVVIAGMVTYTDFTHPDPAVRSQHRQELRSYIDAAAQLGVNFLRVTAGQNHPGVNGRTAFPGQQRACRNGSTKQKPPALRSSMRTMPSAMSGPISISPRQPLSSSKSATGPPAAGCNSFSTPPICWQSTTIRWQCWTPYCRAWPQSMSATSGRQVRLSRFSLAPALRP